MVRIEGAEPLRIETRGRKPNREKYATAIQEAERKFSDKLPEVADIALELALGAKPERCPRHGEILHCPMNSTIDDEGMVITCEYESHGRAPNERMVQYVLNRIAGVPTSAGAKQVNLEFVQQVTKHIADVFTSVNDMTDPKERTQNFILGLSQLWILVGEG